MIVNLGKIRKIRFERLAAFIILGRMRNLLVLIVLLFAVSTEAVAGVAWTPMASDCQSEGLQSSDIIQLSEDHPISLSSCSGVSFDFYSLQDDGLYSFALFDEPNAEFGVHVGQQISLRSEGEEEIRGNFILRPV